MRKSWAPRVKKMECIDCGTDLVKHAGGGRCQNCYSKNRYRNPEIKKKHYDSLKKWRDKNPDKLKEISRRAGYKYYRSEKGKIRATKYLEKRKLINK